LPVDTSAQDDMLEACRPSQAGSLTSAGAMQRTTQPCVTNGSENKN
jgi:hypothetical protein